MWMNTVDEGSVQWQKLNYSFHTTPPNTLIFCLHQASNRYSGNFSPSLKASIWAIFITNTVVQRNNFLPHN
jgi:hypothetical protein